jgi:hypothetical protein
MNYKVKITAAGWSSFTGDFCSMQFKDGVSVDALPRLIIDRVASIIACELIDDTGAEVGQAGATARLVGLTDVTVPVLEPLRVMTEAEAAAERQQAIATALNAPSNVTLYTQNQLEVIASKEGIPGLRVISDKWRVKGRSINQVIFEILRAQSEFQARVKDKDNEQKRARDAVSAQAAADAVAREIAIAQTARNLSAEAIVKAKKLLDDRVAKDQLEEEGFRADLAAAEKLKADLEGSIGLSAVAAALAPAPSETSNALDENGRSVYVPPPAAAVYVDPQLTNTVA